MLGAGIEKINEENGKLLHLKNGKERLTSKRPRPKTVSQGNDCGTTMSKNQDFNTERKSKRSDSTCRDLSNKAPLPERKSSKKQSSLSCDDENPSATISSGNGEHAPQTTKSLKLKRGKWKKPKKLEHDEASRLQNRTRYLLIKMKLEQNLIDAYSAEGWKGQSREKIRPENELQRAKKQILKCKLGIRDAIRQLDLLSSIGCIEDSAVAADGSVYHEHIICAKCKLREAFPDNDIILCDGTCNCAFHQKCLDPPLLTEDIPPGDQGWFCKFCECKLGILETMNAHLGTKFSMDSSWQDIFKEEAALPDDENTLLHPDEEWPSEDSEDDDYDPENLENSCSYSTGGSKDSDESSSSSTLRSLDDEVFSELGRSERRCSEILVGADSDETTDCEITRGRRQRRAVDYKKLYDEMFGKDAHANEPISEDEDWGPKKRKRREKESDAASTLMTLCESEEKRPNGDSQKLGEKLPSRKNKRHLFRIPCDAVEKLRLVFSENELPSRAVRENLSMQLGIEYAKINKWFKNARYLALKARKAKSISPVLSTDFGRDSGKDVPAVQMPSKDMSSENVIHMPKLSNKLQERRNPESLNSPLKAKNHIGKDAPADQMPPTMSSEYVIHMPKNLKKFHERKKLQSLNSPLEEKNQKRGLSHSPTNNKASPEFADDDVSLKLLKEKAKREKKKDNSNAEGDAQEAEAEMERLCRMMDKVEKLQQVLLGFPNRISSKADGLLILNELPIVYVPVAEVREKR